MAKNLEGETIAAIATPPGSGGVGIIRISGPDSLKITQKIFKTHKKTLRESHKAVLGWAVDNSGDKLDQVLAIFMKKPNSYTGENVVELSCHGGQRVLSEVLDLSVSAGARLAEKGEFTKRALLNGKIDLSQAEAVLDLINSRTKEGVIAASDQLEGSLSKEIEKIKRNASIILANLEASIDFPDEIRDMPFSKEKTMILSVQKSVDNLISTAEYGRLYREGINVAITGKPNVGKSSILNAILKEERAIVTEVPGTTRDTIEEGINIKGIPVNLVDTAGLRIAGDHIEKIGIKKAREAAVNADILIVVIDASKKLSKEDIEALTHVENKPLIVVLNKTDLGEKVSQKELGKTNKIKPDLVKTSAINGTGIKKLESEIFKKATSNTEKNDSKIMINSRHKECLIRAKESLQKCLESVKKRMQADFIAIDLRAAISALGEITGEQVGDEIIAQIFDQFCVGK